MVYGMRFVSSLIPSLSLPHCWVSFPRSLSKQEKKQRCDWWHGSPDWWHELYLIGDTGHLIDDTGHLIGDTGHLIGDTGHLIDDTGHLIGATGHLIGDTGHLIDTSHLIGDTMPQWLILARCLVGMPKYPFLPTQIAKQ